MKKTLSVLLIISMLLAMTSFASCGKDEEETKISTETETETTAASESEPTETEAGEAVAEAVQELFSKENVSGVMAGVKKPLEKAVKN